MRHRILQKTALGLLNSRSYKRIIYFKEMFLYEIKTQ
jgi:hypothetical protein